MSDRTGPPAEPSAATVVLVVGMHRSGTSGVASALGSLGLALPGGDDLLGRRRGNEQGHFESASLIEESDAVFHHLGAAWDDPPLPKSVHAAMTELEPLVRRAGAAFGRAFPDRGRAACWKDPRSALLLPFWRAAIDRPIAAVLCVRHPLEAALSLEHRDAVALPAALALWERYLREAVSGLSGLPVLVSDYADALAEPAAWNGQVREWLASLGITADAQQSAAEPALDPALRHFRADGDSALVAATQQQLYEELRQLRGAHGSFSYEAAGTESPWTSYVLQQRHDALRTWRAVEWLAQELAVQLLAVPEPEAPLPDTVTQYCMNATEDEARYHAWLVARGESPAVSTDTAASILASSPPAAMAGTALERATVRTGLRGALARTPSPRRSRRPAPAAPRARERPTFSVIVPCYRPRAAIFDRCVASVLAQSYSGWELCICDDASGDRALTERLGKLAAADGRILTTTRSGNGGISAATNEALRLASGRYVVFLDHDDELHPAALERIARTISEHPEADLIYSDEDKIDEAGRRFLPTFKPDWSPDLLLSNAYMCHVLVVRRDLVAQLGGLRSEFDGAQDYDLMLRVGEVTSAIVHVPEVLYHWRMTPGSASGDAGAKPWAFEAGRRVLEETARRRGIDASVVQHPDVPGSYHFIRRPRPGVLVSAIIPFRDEPALTAACYRSFIEQPGYDNFELVLVDNDSALPETRALLEDLARDHRVRLVEAPGAFDWVAINNEAARKARGDLLLFLNNDVMARSPHWLGHMVAQAQRPEVGAVGARLLYPDGTIQHAGVVVGIGLGATHVQQGITGDKPGYLSLTTITRNVSAVTGACLMTPRSAFEAVGGFDANLPIAFNDIDYCLKLRERGLLVIYTPLAEMTHHESKSRGHSDDVKEAPYFRKRWRTVMLAGDPYYNRNLGRFDNSCRLPV
ncbi:MAG: glycosyltransferase, partial [Acidimicrobiales bacterium]